MNRYPAHVVVAWLGNSERVAIAHYLKVTPEHIAQAVTQGVGQQVGTSWPETTSLEGNEQKEILEIPEENEKAHPVKDGPVHLAGFEPATFGSVDRCSIQLSYKCIS
jgi:hypothetical protein